MSNTGSAKPGPVLQDPEIGAALAVFSCMLSASAAISTEVRVFAERKMCSRR